MNNAIQLTNAIETALIGGDLSKLTAEQRLGYYKAVCESVGLNPLTKPFDYITLNGKLTLYAKRDATDQLRNVNKVSITITARELIGDIYVVTARARHASGREDESTGAVCIKGLNGDNLANAYMKSETKAKRRVTLSICGLGLLDESEIDSIPGASRVSEEGMQKAQRVQQELEQKPEANVVQMPKPQDLETPFDDDFPPDMPGGEHPLASYVFPDACKKFAKRKMGDIPMKELGDYSGYMRSWYQKEGKQPRGTWVEILDNIDAYLGVK